ncbi:hypothetical protein QYE76_043755 [Lolium multiflorum]|uniref:Uncharacterized protein n=1 Tax=Lolium multiflorum TaxID=4521 RepID=A0AAD8WVU5_LOLMU|nr:hypothetical protein QYE76_043755 [Lolium multiflorum]
MGRESFSVLFSTLTVPCMVGGDEEGDDMIVNSYHHQGVCRLAERFVSMAFASDGLVERFYDPDTYNPCDDKFIMGLQFHPERMHKACSDEFDTVFASCDHFVRLKLSNQPHYPSTHSTATSIAIVP